MMLKHYLKIATRNMTKFRTQTLVSLVGLAVGMTCFALGTLWLRYIESFEDYVPDAENICYLSCGYDESRASWRYYSRFPDGEKLADLRPEVKDWCTIQASAGNPGEGRKTALSVEGHPFQPIVIHADSSFFRFFGVKAKAGDVKHFGPGQVVLTESMAQKMFDGKPAVGEEVFLQTNFWQAKIGHEEANSVAHVVTAVVPDCPDNTQFFYEAILPFNDIARDQYSAVYDNFIRLHPAAPRDSIVGRTLEVEYPIGSSGLFEKKSIVPLPLRELRSQYPSPVVQISTDYVRWFMFIGLLVIVCSLTNYLITMTSHLRRRGWEFSLRRVLGSSRANILYMVSLEALLTFLLSTLLALLLILLVLPYFREYSNIDIGFSAIVPRLAAYLAFVIAGGMAISALTAWVVMRRTQHNILASRQLGHASNRLDRIGVMLQMALSMAIIFSLTVMLRQIRMLMYSDELGFNHRNIGVVFYPSEELRNRIRQSPLVDGDPADNIYQLFPRHFSAQLNLVETDDEGKALPSADFVQIDTAMQRIYDIRLVEGRMPIPGSDRKDVDTIDFYGYQRIVYTKDLLVNETFCRENNLTPQNAIGKKLTNRGWGDRFQIVGVVKDMYVAGPTQKPMPTTYAHITDYRDQSMAPANSDNITFHAKPGRLGELCDSINHWLEGAEKTGWQMPSLTNVEEEFDRYVASEQMLIKILLAVGGASLFVCVIGTFSLVSLSLQQRRKEIAIRKVHGARMRDIFALFLRGQVVSLLVAAVVAYPLAYIVMKHWLEGYQKQITIGFWLIPATFLAIAAVVLLTISLKIWRAAKEKTVEALNS